jgi:hypothetical protein
MTLRYHQRHEGRREWESYDPATKIYRTVIEYLPGPEMLPPRQSRGPQVEKLLRLGLLKVIERRAGESGVRESYISKRPEPSELRTGTAEFGSSRHVEPSNVNELA